MTETPLLETVEALAQRIPDGAHLAVAKDECGTAMAATRALIRRRVTGLHLLTVPTSGLQTDLLIGAGAVASVECGAITLGEYGQAPCFGRAVAEGTIGLKDSTCPAIYAGLQAAEKGIPFLPLRGLLGSDVAAHRDAFKVIDNPFDDDDPIIAVKASRPDVALIHAPLADRHGNVWVGRHRPLMIMAHAARETLATVEDIFDGNLLEDPKYGPATLSSLYVSAIAQAKNGAWPLGLTGFYDDDAEHLAEYVRLAATVEGFAEYLDRHVLNGRAAAE